MQKRTSLKDIATKVGVSTALVSYVMNGKAREKRVGKELAEKIRQVAEELNYTPNQIAQSLRKGSTKTIGVIVADIANPFFGNLARVIENEANHHGYTVIFGSSDEESVKSGHLIETLMNRQVDGFIIVPAEGSEEQIVNLQSRKVPVVLIDRYFRHSSNSYVALDNYGACFEATNYLINKGFKNIGQVVYKTSMIHIKERIRGYVEAMKHHGLENRIRIEEVRYGVVMEDTAKAVIGLTSGKAPCDALFFATNTLSICGLYAIREQELIVPDQLGVLGFDGNEVFDFFYSPLTYIEQPLREMGKEAVKILVEEMNGSEKIAHIKMKHQLISRESCR